MMRPDADSSSRGRRVEPLAGLALLGALAAPAAADAKSSLRLVHAVPGAGQAELRAVRGGDATPVGRAGFGSVSSYAKLGRGAVTLQLRAPGGGKTLASLPLQIRDGRRYTVVALLDGEDVKLKVFRDGKAKRGASRVRVVHAVPELGAPQISFDGKPVMRRLAYQAATPYLTVKPGRHTYAAGRPGAKPVLRGAVTLKPHTAYSAFVVGSRGEKVRVVPAADAVARRAAAKPQDKPSKPQAKPDADRRSGSSASYMVRRGDSLWSIAERGLPAGAGVSTVSRRVQRLWRANKARIGTGDPNVILAGTRLRLS